MIFFFEFKSFEKVRENRKKEERTQKKKKGTFSPRAWLQMFPVSLCSRHRLATAARGVDSLRYQLRTKSLSLRKSGSSS